MNLAEDLLDLELVENSDMKDEAIDSSSESLVAWERAHLVI